MLGWLVDFPTERLRLFNCDSSNNSLEFPPILPFGRSSRSIRDVTLPNTANLTPLYQVFDSVIAKDGQGRASSRSVLVDSEKGDAREKHLFYPARLKWGVFLRKAGMCYFLSKYPIAMNAYRL